MRDRTHSARLLSTGVWLMMVLVLALLACSAMRLQALSVEEIKALGFRQHPGAALPLSLSFTDEGGKPVQLKEAFGKAGVPVIIVPGYFRCRTLCSGVSDGILRALQGQRRTAGHGFNVVYISIDPNEKLADAQSGKRTWLKRYGRLGAEEGCVFLTGGAEEIEELARKIGFEYRFDPPSGEFAHPAGFLIATPEGRIFRYFLGVSFSAQELETALEGAARGAEGSFVRDLFLLCFHYNPIRSRYGVVVMGIVRVLALATMAGLAVAIVRSHRRRKEGTPL